jgi:hypothetical protein
MLQLAVRRERKMGITWTAKDEYALAVLVFIKLFCEILVSDTLCEAS